MSGSRRSWPFWWVWPLLALWLAAGVIGAWAIVQRFWVGKELAAYSSYVPWGLWVALYIYLMGLSAGAFLLSSLVYVFQMSSLERLGRPALWTALVAMLCAVLMITLDLGHPERAYRVLWAPNFTSMMAWMVWLYGAYFVLLVLELWLAVRAPHSKTLHRVATVGIPLAVTFNGGVGALFGVIGAQPGWNTALFPILFLTGALTSGSAVLLVLAVTLLGEGRNPRSPAVETLRRALLGFLVLDAIFVWSELSIGIYASIPGHAEVHRSILFGPYWYNFWLVQVGLGLVVPLVLLSQGRHRPRQLALAAVLVATAFVGVRLNYVIPDLVLPSLAGFETAYQDHRLKFEYFPSFNEWAVACGILAFGGLVFFLGWRYLPIAPRPVTSEGVDREGATSAERVNSEAVDELVKKRRGWIAAVATALGGLVAGWGFWNTTRKPRYASGGTRKALPVLPADGSTDVLYRMQVELDRALAKPVAERKWGMVIDTRKCIGCHACTIACVAENHLPPGVVYRPVLTEEMGKFPNVALRFIPRPCMQCEEPPCVPVCPVKATYTRPDGIIEINYDTCIGCRYCLTACPYNARTSDFGDMHTSQTPELQPYETASSFEYGKEWNRAAHGSPVGNARKCHFCLHRLERGLLPECVTSCIGRATFFGDLNDPEGLVAQLSAQPNRMVLLEHLGTRPKVTYLT
jgi:molybdopterin-containing oxidoreductase family iron-sulfur binding subunit